ncbi:hypothetical protein [Nostoc foliaceum]|uniref:Uncharacterized protein n=2 Tax=Nostoc TaxID=1177 RepID=A0ABR8ILL1_9NOSO|nr:hypothetical protein [Nostoc foliaceum]MBD2566216.1 hypothetical protein [Nostoc linckia FACHB-391]MBD2651852.1 hypothetical protein [Nostoc foliaceum FACHB-393]
MTFWTSGDTPTSLPLNTSRLAALCPETVYLSSSPAALFIKSLAGGLSKQPKHNLSGDIWQQEFNISTQQLISNISH